MRERDDIDRMKNKELRRELRRLLTGDGTQLTQHMTSVAFRDGYQRGFSAGAETIGYQIQNDLNENVLPQFTEVATGYAGIEMRILAINELAMLWAELNADVRRARLKEHSEYLEKAWRRLQNAAAEIGKGDTFAMEYIAYLVEKVQDGVIDALATGRATALQQFIGNHPINHQLKPLLDSLTLGRPAGVSPWRILVYRKWNEIEKQKPNISPTNVRHQLLKQLGEQQAGAWRAKSGLTPDEEKAFDSLLRTKDVVEYRRKLFKAVEG